MFIKIWSIDMKWVLGVASLAFISLTIVQPARDFESRYPRIESYQIRPGVFATPSYAKTGVLCAVSIEKRHVQGDTVDLGSTIPHKVALEIIDELVPPSERGKPTMQLAGHDYIDLINGSSDVAIAEYEKVSIQIHGTSTHATVTDSGDLAVVITWKNACSSTSRSDRTP
jgi:hypothetical protein